MKPEVSVIIPVYNEEKYLKQLFLSIESQTYPKSKMEWLFIDGGSTDQTIAMIENFQKKYPAPIRILNNNKRIPPAAMNIGIKYASGQYIIRFDAHTQYPPDYIEKCVYYLTDSDISNVGGGIYTVGDGYWGKLNAIILSSKFGVGNSKFRTEKQTAFVDTVPFGAFKKEIFEKVGLFDERLARSEDNELNYRIRKSGGKILMAEDISSTYHCRDSLKGLLKMALENGKAVALTSKLCPGAMSYRHFVPVMFSVSLLSLVILSFLSDFILWKWLLLSECAAYILLSLLCSIKDAAGRVNSQFAVLMFIYFYFHFTYGLGTMVGIYEICRRKWKK